MDLQTLKFAAMLCVHRLADQVVYPGKDTVGQLKRSLSDAVLTETNRRVSQLEQANKELKEELEEQNKVNEDLKQQLQQVQILPPPTKRTRGTEH